jgi:Domain of unknown function (DUF4436)
MAWNKSHALKVSIALSALGLYALALYQNVKESNSQSLQFKDETAAEDRVLVRVTVTDVNAAARQLTAQLGFRFAGNIAQDEVTPGVNLKLLVNSVTGGQEFDFPRGKRMHRIEAVFPMDGDLNRYPFDHYEANLSFLVTTPSRAKQPDIPEVQKNKSKKSRIVQKIAAERPDATALAVGETALQGNVPVPLSISVLASVRQIKFSGSISRKSDSDPTELVLNLKRPNRAMRISIVVMILMMSLAISVLAMALRAITSRNESDLLPLSFALTLIFGLPALRMIQPGIPPVGVLGDNLSFTWAELIVAASAVIIMWTWLIRTRTN